VLRPAVSVIDAVRIAPNPAQQYARIWVRSRIAGVHVRVKVYSIAGELVAKLDFGQMEFVTWNLTNNSGEDLSAGVYLVVIQATDPQSGQTERQIHKLAVLR